MKQYDAKKILNIALAGHSGSGKTSVAESILYLSKMSERLGKVADGNTVLDFDSEEIKRQTSIMTAVAPIEWKNTKINLIDTPGLFDFAGGVAEGMRAADTALVVVSGKDGVCVGTEKAVEAATKAGLTKVFFVNGLCDESARFYRVFESLKATFGPSVCPVVVPYIVDGQANTYVNLFDYKAYEYGTDGSVKQTALPDMGDRLEGLREAIKEAVAETSEELLDKFIMGEEFTPEEIILGVSQGVKDGTICPVFCGDAHNTFAIDQLLNSLTWLAPSAADKSGEIGVDLDGEPVDVSVNDGGAAAAIVFKTVADPFIGRLSYVKVVSGKVSSDAPLINMRTGAQERITKVLSVSGKKQSDVPYIGAGDIGAIPKLASTKTGDTLCSPLRKVVLDGIDYPSSSYTMAVYPAKKGDEDKVAQGIAKLADEDPTIKLVSNHETHEMLISGLGEQHLDVVISRLKTKYNVDAVLKKPKIAYRETIRKKVSAQGRYKKQSGGHGQFGHVFLDIEPLTTGEPFEFVDKIFGGAVPRQYIPAVEKGVRETLEKGLIAGFPMINVKVTLTDGSYHPVDSSEMAFKVAAGQALKKAVPEAKPILLEPIYNVDVVIPEDYMGDVMGDFSSRRGRILGMEHHRNRKGIIVVKAQVPLAEMRDYVTILRSMTQGKGTFNMEFYAYEEVPKKIMDEIIEKRQAE